MLPMYDVCYATLWRARLLGEAFRTVSKLCVQFLIFWAVS